MRGFGAGSRKAHALGTGDQPVDELRPPHLQLVRGAPVRAELHLALDRLHHGGMAVTQQQRAMAAEVVDVLVAVDVPLAGAGGPRGIDRIRQQRAAVVRQAGGDHLPRPLVELGRAPRPRPVFRLDPRVRSRHRNSPPASEWPQLGTMSARGRMASSCLPICGVGASGRNRSATPGSRRGLHRRGRLHRAHVAHRHPADHPRPPPATGWMGGGCRGRRLAERARPSFGGLVLGESNFQPIM